MDNEALEQRFASGGVEELECAVNLYGEKLLRYAAAILCDYQEAEDVVQEVFISAYQNRSGFDGINLSAWLYKITYHRSLNQLKKPKFLYFGVIRDKAAVSDDCMGLSDEMLGALRRLKPKDRALLYGRIINGLSYEELSLLTGHSHAALRKRYERAKKKLAEYLISADTYSYGKGRKHGYN